MKKLFKLKFGLDTKGRKEIDVYECTFFLVPNDYLTCINDFRNEKSYEDMLTEAMDYLKGKLAAEGENSNWPKNKPIYLDIDLNRV